MTQPVYSRNHPYLARVLGNRRLNKVGAHKDTRLIELSLGDSGFSYRPGDSLGVMPLNPTKQVDEFLRLLELTASEHQGLRELLIRNHALNRACSLFVKALVPKLPHGAERTRMEHLVNNVSLLEEYLRGRDYIDVLREFPKVRFTPEELPSILRKTNPRLYSIASSMRKHPNEVHLAVSVVSYQTHGRKKLGLASGYLAEHVSVGERIPVFVQPSRHFHLPASDRDIIMIGPGVGIAPFRGFLEEREAQGAQGRNWLFFGDWHRATDFLFEEELMAFERHGVLTRMDVAFSRDQKQKIYVQDRLLERQKEIWDWIQNGAYIYVCGDAKLMAKDVYKALIKIASHQGGMTTDQATVYIEDKFSKEEKRYLRDVY